MKNTQIKILEHIKELLDDYSSKRIYEDMLDGVNNNKSAEQIIEIYNKSGFNERKKLTNAVEWIDALIDDCKNE